MLSNISRSFIKNPQGQNFNHLIQTPWHGFLLFTPSLHRLNTSIVTLPERFVVLFFNLFLFIAYSDKLFIPSILILFYWQILSFLISTHNVIWLTGTLMKKTWSKTMHFRANPLTCLSAVQAELRLSHLWTGAVKKRNLLAMKPLFSATAVSVGSGGRDYTDLPTPSTYLHFVQLVQLKVDVSRGGTVWNSDWEVEQERRTGWKTTGVHAGADCGGQSHLVWSPRWVQTLWCLLLETDGKVRVGSKVRCFGPTHTDASTCSSHLSLQGINTELCHFRRYYKVNKLPKMQFLCLRINTFQRKTWWLTAKGMKKKNFRLRGSIHHSRQRKNK